MAITWMDGFEDYSSANGLLTAVYLLTNSITYGDAGRFSGKSLRLGGGGFVRKGIATTDTLSLGFAVKATNSGTFTDFIDFRDAANNIICTVYYSALGAISIVRGNSSTTNILATSSTGALALNTWAYIEVELTRSASSGAAAIYVNGVEVASATGVNTGSTSISAVHIGSPNGNMNIDDLYITDTATRLGELRLDTLVPTADTTTADFTPLTGTSNYAMVDELPVDGDTSYVSAATTGNSDLYTTAGLSNTPDNILAVQVRAVARKTDTGLRSVKAKLNSGGTEADGVGAAMSTTYTVVDAIYATDPNTSTAWTAAAVNAAKIGMEIAS